MVWRSGRVHVNDTAHVVPLQAPAAFGATTFDAGQHRRLSAHRPLTHSSDGERFTRLRQRRARVPAGDPRQVAPRHLDRAPGTARARLGAAHGCRGKRELQRHQAAVAGAARLDSDRAPRVRRPDHRAMRSSLAYILINRDGPAIQPGSRSYERSWIRDGSLTSAALLRLGGTREVREFIDWYAPFQYANGKVPCCVDSPRRRPGAGARQPRRVHLSHRRVRTLHRRYAPSLDAIWPRIVAAVGYIDTLRRQRMTPEFDAPDKRALLRPPAAVDQPRGLLGQADALVLGRLLRAARPQGRRRARHSPRRDRGGRVASARSRDDVPRDLIASIQAAMRMHKIDFIPGCGGARRLRRDLDDGRPGARRRAGTASRSRRSSAPSSGTARTSARGATGRNRGRPTRRTSCAPSGRSCASAGATARTSCSTVFFRTSARRLEPVGRGRLARPAQPRSSSATCRTPGSARTSSARCSTCSPTSARRTGAARDRRGYRG